MARNSADRRMVMIAEDYRRRYGWGIAAIASKLRFASIEHEGEPPPIEELGNETQESFSEVVERAKWNAARRRETERDKSETES